MMYTLTIKTLAFFWRITMLMNCRTKASPLLFLENKSLQIPFLLYQHWAVCLQCTRIFKVFIPVTLTMKADLCFPCPVILTEPIPPNRSDNICSMVQGKGCRVVSLYDVKHLLTISRETLCIYTHI